MSWLKTKADAEAQKIRDTLGDDAYLLKGMVADAIEAVAREFAERVIRVNNSEYEIHRHGTPDRLIELTIEAADKDET